MIVSDIIVSVSVVVLLCINSVFIGYCIGQRIKDRSEDNPATPSFFAKNINGKKETETTNETKSISIDESKVVVSLDTTNLEKKYNQLGEVKQSSENITSSIDRLKHLKK